MNKFSNSISNTLEKIQFKKIRVAGISTIAVSLFLLFLTVYMPLSSGYSSGLTASIINLLSMIVLIMLLVFVSANSDFNTFFVTIILYGLLAVISLVVTVLNFIDFIDIYKKGTEASYLISDSKQFLTMNMLLYILDVISFIALIVAIVFLLIDIKKRKASNSKISFMIPLLIFVGNFVINLVYLILVFAFGYKYSMLQSITALIISASWVIITAYLETRPKVTADYVKQNGGVANNAEYNASLKENQDYHYINTGIVLHFFLIIVTCGIWNYIGIFKITRYLSSMNKEYYRDPITKLLLFMFIPFYSYYWYYKSGVIVDSLNKRSNGKSGALLCILSIFFPGASFLVLINKAQELEFTMPPQDTNPVL